MSCLILVDDEIQARKYLRALVARHCPDFEVLAEAETGAEALELALRLRPDLVVTDVRMPGMDGLELSRRLQTELPGTSVVVVSGYEEFEYARSALKAGVVDYLLKPVVAEQLKAVLGEVAARVASRLYEARCRALRELAFGSAVQGARGPGSPAGEQARAPAQARLPEGRYSAAALRLGPPPSRFPAADSVSVPFPAAPLSRLRELGVWTFPGRDGRELLLVRSSDLVDGGEFEAATSSLAQATGVAYRVLAFGSELFALGELYAVAAALLRAVDLRSTPGRPIALRGAAARRGGGQEDVAAAFDAATSLSEQDSLDDFAARGRFERLLAEARFAELERALREAVGSWEREGRSAVQARSRLRRVFDIALRYRAVGGASAESLLGDEDSDSLADEVVAAAVDYAELADRAVEIVDRLAGRPARTGGNEDVPAFFASIKLYVEERFSEEISLQLACACFGISQTYLSRLFRKYEGLSFNDYLTRTRIEAAKRLMAEDPVMPLKDVAARAGYQDQFYFSRVFKAVVGLPPSEYAARSRRGLG